MELTTPSGRLRGTVSTDGTVARFLGVPYAQPPVGAFRWRPPQPLAHWSGVRDATSFGPASLQRPRPTRSIMFFGDEPSSEDCLYLNVWTPVRASGPLPVMVWIHGGGFYYGSGSLSKYDGQALASLGTVVVTVNYRLGPLGFLAHPELSAEGAWRTSGNYGLLDQIAALRWVRDMIGAFQGDPDRVTIFGQSVGAVSVNSLMASPLARGLFHRAISQSGGAMGHLGSAGSGCMQTLPAAEEAGEHYARRLGAATLEALRRMPAAEVQFLACPVEANERDYMKLLPIIRQSGWPIVDGAVLERSNMATFRSAAQAKVPLISGWNDDEGSAAPAPATLDALKASLAATYGSFSEKLLAHYMDGSRSPAQVARLIVGHRGFCWQNRATAQTHAMTSGQPVFAYNFSHRPPIAEEENFEENARAELGAFHTAEIPYVFGNLDVRAWPWVSRDRDLAAQMARYWVNFAAGGDPNGGGDLPAWPSYAGLHGTSGTSKVLQFGSVTQAVAEPMQDTFALWDDYFATVDGCRDAEVGLEEPGVVDGE